MKRAAKKKTKKVTEPSLLGRSCDELKGKLKSKPDASEAIKQKKIFQKYFNLLEKCEKS